MVDNAISRVARAMDIIPYVLENPGISIENLAAKFGVNQKQIIKETVVPCEPPPHFPGCRSERLNFTSSKRVSGR